MRAIDPSLAAVLMVGLLSSTVLLSASSVPPSVTVSQLWGLGSDTDLTVSGVLVSLRSYDSGSEVMVLADESGERTVKVVCSPGPGPEPSSMLSVGDLVRVAGECAFEEGVPTVYCRYNEVLLLLPSEEALTVGMLCDSWRLFEGDRISVSGEVVRGGDGSLRLLDPGGECSIAMLLDEGLAPVEGGSTVGCVLALDAETMALTLFVYSIVLR